MEKITGKVGYRDYRWDTFTVPDSIMPLLEGAYDRCDVMCSGSYPNELSKILEEKGYKEESVCALEVTAIYGNTVELNIDLLAYAPVTIEVSDNAAKLVNETLKGRVFDTVDHFDSEIIESLVDQGYAYEDLIYFGCIDKE